MRRTVKLFAFTSMLAGVMALTVSLAPFSICQNPTVKVNGTPPGWSDEINLSNDSVYRDVGARIAVNGSNIHAVWLKNYNTVVYSKSINEGRTWSVPVSLYYSGPNVDEQVIGVNNNSVHVAWSLAYKVMYRNSTDNGDTWSDVKIISNDSNALAMIPKMFVNQSNIHIIWGDSRDGPDGEIYYRHSLDGGTTFDNGQGIDQDRRITFSPATISNIQIAGYGSNISIVWSDERNGNWEIYWMISKDNGYTWEDGLGNVNIDRKISDSTSDSIDPTIIISGSNIHIVWADMAWPGPIYRLYYRNSTDNGATWNPIQLLSGPFSVMVHPDIDVEGGNISVVWQDRRDDGTHEQLYYKNSTDGGISWNPDLRLTYNLTRKSQGADIKVVNGTTHLIWHDIFSSSDREVMYKRYPDFPDTSPPHHSNEIPYPDSYKDAPGTNVSVHVTDPSGVNESTIQLYVNGSLVSHTSTPITDGYNVSWNSSGFEPGVVTCRIVADDNCGNQLDYTWNFTVLALYGIQLHEGWNLISVPFVQVNTSIKEVLRDIDGKWDFIEYYDATSREWKSYATFWPESLNEFNEINNTMAIWINITEPDVNLTSRGIISTNTEIPLKAGWNFVGYPTQTTETVGNALWRTGADRVDVFDPTDPYRTKEVASTYIMKPGEGYWVHVVADSIWAINW